ncbi:UNVERIFIED_CONTAM: UDP-glycosyltransferase 86A1 [Sesamum latifolium]|uniref:UDP-glycosyltransferase 86A1 n=1 Tax=Sesamum latifolium TaxID=2727402 RepID=A0AAW2TY68_9LAMI
MAAENRGKPHAIMISVPYQGHINPFVNLALKIASKGFSITFVHFEFVHHRLSKAHHCNKTQVDIFSEARESGLDIRYTTISDGLPLEFDRDANYDEFWGKVLREFPARVDEFVRNTIESDPHLLHFLVADTVFSWPATIAEKYNLVNVSLWTEPALVFSLAYHLDLLIENGHFPWKDNIHEEVNYVPGVKSISTRDLISVMKESGQGYNYTMLESVFMAFEQVKKADFILHNTVHELEAETLKSLWSESDCTEWLESKPPGSVLYVSFGSFVHTSKQEIEEIAYGLLLSEVHFIWVVREGILSSGDTKIMPDGYEDEVKDKGLIIPWSNQIMVLSNPAVGGFLTHNGWNSTIESLWCGVPMICYPFLFDQPTNRKLVVDDWKCGISLCDGTSVDRNEVAEKIKSFMSGAASKRFRQEANKVKTILHHALEVDGSSEKNFNQFIKDLKEKIHSKTSIDQ